MTEEQKTLSLDAAFISLIALGILPTPENLFNSTDQITLEECKEYLEEQGL